MLIRPAPPAGLEHAAAVSGAPRGSVSSSWRRAGKALVLTIDISRQHDRRGRRPRHGPRQRARYAPRPVRFERTASSYVIFSVAPARYTFIVTRSARRCSASSA
jgi:hypothetical protein